MERCPQPPYSNGSPKPAACGRENPDPPSHADSIGAVEAGDKHSVGSGRGSNNLTIGSNKVPAPAQICIQQACVKRGGSVLMQGRYAMRMTQPLRRHAMETNGDSRRPAHPLPCLLCTHTEIPAEIGSANLAKSAAFRRPN